MANKKISQLASASALAGTEVLPVVQAGTTKKVTTQAIADLAAGGGGDTFSITANGIVGGDAINVSYITKAIVPSSALANNMSQGYSVPVANYAAFSWSSQDPGGYGGGYGANTTATNIAFNARYMADFTLNTGTGVTTLSFPELLIHTTSQMGSSIGGSGLTTLSAAKVTSLNPLTFNNVPSLTTLNFPSLVSMPGYSGIMFNGTNNISSITSANFPVLEDVNFSFYEPGSLVTVDIPSAKKFKGCYIASSGMMTGNAVITTLNFPGLVDIANPLQFDNKPTLTNVSFGTVGTLKKFSSGWVFVNFDGCNLTQASVDGLLTLFASLDGTNGTTTSNGGTLLFTGGTNAAPSQIGLDAKAVLIARGWQVGHN